MKKMNQKGFTLAELLIVVAVIAILVAVAIPTFSTQMEKARQAVDISNLREAYAAARLAEINGNVDGVAFADNERALKLAKDVTASTGAADKRYTSYWYDPETGKLILIPKTANPENEPDEGTEGSRAGSIFRMTAQFGRAQTEKVVADTTQLSKVILYQDVQLKQGPEIVATADDTAPKTVWRAGTLDKAIRVTFYHTSNGPFKLHEISYVTYPHDVLYTEGMEDDLTITLATGKTGSETNPVEITKAGTSGSFDATTLLVNGIVYSADNYTLTVSNKTGNTYLTGVTAPTDGKTVTLTLTVPAAPDTSTDPSATESYPQESFTVTVTDKDDITRSGTFTVYVKRGTT